LEAPPAVAAGDLARGARGGANADRLDADDGDEPLLVDVARVRRQDVGDRVGGNANMVGAFASSTSSSAARFHDGVRAAPSSFITISNFETSFLPERSF